MACSSKKDSKLTVKVDPIQVFGKAEGNEDEIIGLVGGLAVDAFDNLYVTDNAFKKIKIFSNSGMLVKTMGRGEGRGPGEFLDLRTIDVDSSGNVYVVDMSKLEITMFDTSGKVIKTLKTPFKPTQIVSYSPANVFVTGFPDSYQGDLIYKYDLTVVEADAPVLRFCERYTGPHQWEIEHVGETNRISKSTDGGILFGTYFPYIIRKFSPEGKLEYELTRSPHFYRPPYLKSKETRYIMPLSGSKACVFLQEDVIINLIYEINEGRKLLRLYLDFWDADHKEFLGMVSATDLGIELSFHITTDRRGSLYVFSDKPYPRVIKYRVILSRKAV